MSVSRITGKLTFAMLMALALGGCVVASGSSDEGSSEKTEQAATETTAANKNARSEDSIAPSVASETSGSNGGSSEAEPQPEPWVTNDPTTNVATPKKFVEPRVDPVRARYPE